MYDVNKDKSSLIAHIRAGQINMVFINMASLVRYAKPIKEAFGDKVKIILLSHGNHSGDFLHLISKPIKPVSKFRSLMQKFRVGLLIATESLHRVKYLDAVIALSETEAQIENWFGAKTSLFLPRRLTAGFLNYQPKPGRVGFVGRLDHPPNLQGMQILLDSLSSANDHSIEIRLVGTPDNFGKQLADKYPQVTYLGELSDKDLEEEVSTWALLLNPVWWYSTGASTKLAKAISWGVPIITTTAGMRGYKWFKGNLLVADTPVEMCNMIIKNSTDIQLINSNAEQTRMVANNGCEVKALAEMVKQLIA
jgi:glycosyltransferase involved in cell wall biosynthesis